MIIFDGKWVFHDKIGFLVPVDLFFNIQKGKANIKIALLQQVDFSESKVKSLKGIVFKNFSYLTFSLYFWILRHKTKVNKIEFCLL